MGPTEQVWYQPGDIVDTIKYEVTNVTKDTKIKQLRVFFDDEEFKTNQKVHALADRLIVYSGISKDIQLEDGKHVLKAEFYLDDGTIKSNIAKILVDRTGPKIIPLSPAGRTQRIEVVDGQKIVSFKAFYHNGSKFSQIENVKEIFHTTRKHIYEITLQNDDFSWDKIAYQASDSGNRSFRLAIGDDKQSEGFHNVIRRFPQTREKTPKLQPIAASASSCVYQAVIYIPFWYYTGLNDGPHPNNYEERRAIALESIPTISQGLHDAIQTLINPQLVKYGYEPISGDFEFKLLPLARDYWMNVINGHPYFKWHNNTSDYFITHHKGSISGIFNGNSNSYDPDPLGIGYETEIVKPHDKEAIFIFDSLNKFACGDANVDDGFLRLMRKPFDALVCTNDLAFTYAHEIGHSLSLDHVSVYKDPYNIMCQHDSNELGAYCAGNPHTLSKDQARALSARLCGVPNETLTFLQTSEFGVNPFFTGSAYECGNGLIGYEEQCENGFVEFNTDNGATLDGSNVLIQQNSYCVTEEPANGLAVHPDWARYCVKSNPVSGKECSCEYITPPGIVNAGGGSAPSYDGDLGSGGSGKNIKGAVSGSGKFSCHPGDPKFPDDQCATNSDCEENEQCSGYPGCVCIPKEVQCDRTCEVSEDCQLCPIPGYGGTINTYAQCNAGCCQACPGIDSKEPPINPH